MVICSPNLIAFQRWNCWSSLMYACLLWFVMRMIWRWRSLKSETIEDWKQSLTNSHEQTYKFPDTWLYQQLCRWFVGTSLWLGSKQQANPKAFNFWNCKPWRFFNHIRPHTSDRKKKVTSVSQQAKEGKKAAVTGVRNFYHHLPQP